MSRARVGKAASVGEIESRKRQPDLAAAVPLIAKTVARDSQRRNAPAEKPIDAAGKDDSPEIPGKSSGDRIAEAPKPRLRRSNCFPRLSVGRTLAVDRTLGTAISWERSVDEAAEKALRQGKLAFVIHVSGDFEIPEFT